ncbi:hypothetical protein D5S19_31185 [Amycolatopsis panacis]|uniref:Uncharacterized protein n=1 Tax=Amycolatopsis panacis TaxID=2340917 RepID=A0A419HJS0_9PSEU|nr:hypothetical protein D5S19_31185 [Amycolatopsis panacis]
MGVLVGAGVTHRFVLSGSVLTHPSRGEAAIRTAAQAPPGALTVVTDPEPAGPPTAVRTMVAACESIPAGSTHHLVVQDDMLLAPGLFDRARAAIAAMPGAALALFSLWDSRNGGAVRLGALTGVRWVRAVNEYTPCAALILPSAVAAGYVGYVRQRWDTWPEDILMHQYLRATGVPCFVSVPNLAEHDDPPSIAGNAFRGPRRSACYRPADRPGQEDRRLDALPAVPFFKNGVAQCVVRVPHADPPRWLHLETEPYLSGLGARHLTAPRVRGLDPVAVQGTWLTAYALGVLTKDANGEVDRGAVAEALRTIGAGGISNSTPLQVIREVQDQLAEVAERALLTGREAELLPRRAKPEITLGGAESTLGEHLAQALTDRGHPVIVSTVDERETVVVRHAGGRLRLDTRELYGPGCPPDSVIGKLVWASLRSKPIRITDGTPALLRPRHVWDLAEAVSSAVDGDGAGGIGSPEISVLELAEIIAQVVRPVPIHDERACPPPTTPVLASPRWKAEFRYRLHHFAQWLAYESEGAGAATRT